VANPKSEGFLDALRNVRNIYVDAWARTTQQITSSDAYARAQKLLTQPGLMAAGFARKATDAWTTQWLGQFNLPSRNDVLGLSTRLTRIEMVLDDLGAALESQKVQAEQPPPRPARAAARAVGES
jgi:hypothetical protein